MEYLILGLLTLSPMTGYELQQFIKNNLSLICSHSAGSVQAALAKLEREGKVAVIRPERPLEVERTERNAGKLKRLYDEGYACGLAFLQESGVKKS